MKKIYKLSLATVVALGSMSSLAADFIDSSEFSGYTRAQYNSVKTGDDKANASTATKMRFRLNVKTEINDNAYSVVRFEANGGDSIDATDDKSGEAAGHLNVELKKAYVNFAIPGAESLRVQAGRDFVGLYDDYANSIKVTADLGVATLGAGLGNQVKTTTATQKGAGSMFFFGSLNETAGLSAQFDFASYAPSKNVGLKSEMYALATYAISGVSATGSYASISPETGDKGSYMAAKVSADVAGWTVAGVFSKSDKKGGIGHDARYTDGWSPYSLYTTDIAFDLGVGAVSQLTTYTEADSSTVSAGVNGSVAGLSVSAAFASNKAGKAKSTELDFSASKELSKNLTASLLFANTSADKDNGLEAASGFRLQALYSF